ncbi:hypothetical protein QYM36_004356 [Artemia franciscana]|uniref:Serpin domain-containing protein n=2 Tax=Artemia franciscana TaxID=6661 RepID=A0AA88IEP2_ARTSF|nr:hypothetical protein QYM36_004356 [Artemia franciscana]
MESSSGRYKEGHVNEVTTATEIALMEPIETAISTEALEHKCIGSKQIINSREVTSTTEFYAGEVDFGIDLFKRVYMDNSEIKIKPTNLFISPFSIHSALLLAYFGSAGKTETNLGKVLRLGDTDKKEAFRSYKATLHRFLNTANPTSKSYYLGLANKVFFDSSEPLSNYITKLLSEELEEMDFQYKSSESLCMINEWVKNQTKGKIGNFLNESDIYKRTRMVLVNAVYFKGDWKHQFNPEKTKPEIFHVSSNKQSFVDMMFQEGRFRHGFCEELMSDILEVPYVGKDISMFILLPSSVKNTLCDVLSKLNRKIWKKALKNIKKVNIEVGIPKFRIEASIYLTEYLKNMGLKHALDPSLADFTNFSSNPDLYIQKLKHKAVVELNEEGSEAVAVTAVTATDSCCRKETKQFICNHPFIFMIYDNMIDSILFIGAYQNPKSRTQ